MKKGKKRKDVKLLLWTSKNWQEQLHQFKAVDIYEEKIDDDDIQIRVEEKT